MFSQRLSLADLIDLCRILRHNLGAGLTLRQVFKQQSERGRYSYRALAARISESLQQGNSLSSTLEREESAFPVLFSAMAKLGEATGHMPEIFGELERYYELELQLRRQFRSQTMLPIIQFFAAVFVIAGVIYILGLIASIRGGPALWAPFGLSGAQGAVVFLGVVFGSLGSLWSLYWVLSQSSRQKAWVDRLFLALPALGPCLRALIMSRFTLALQLTLDSGLSITRAIKLSLEATGNAYFTARAEPIVAALKGGQSLHDALAGSRLFQEDFLIMIATSEESGRVPEMMKHQAQQFHEEVSRRMKTLTTVAGFLVWLCVAGFIIWAIFQLAFVYIDALSGKK